MVVDFRQRHVADAGARHIIDADIQTQPGIREDRQLDDGVPAVHIQLFVLISAALILGGFNGGGILGGTLSDSHHLDRQRQPDYSAGQYKAAKQAAI